MSSGYVTRFFFKSLNLSVNRVNFMIKKNIFRELADIIMEASDDITPGEIEAIADVARDTDNELEKTEIKVVAEMSAKLGESLSNREVNMIGRMMRSSGKYEI